MSKELAEIKQRLERLEKHLGLADDHEDFTSALLASFDGLLEKGESAEQVIEALVATELERRRRLYASLSEKMKAFENLQIKVKEHQKLDEVQKALFEYDLMSDRWQLLDDWQEVAEDYDKEQPTIPMKDWMEERKKRLLEDQAQIWISLGKQGI